MWKYLKLFSVFLLFLAQVSAENEPSLDYKLEKVRNRFVSASPSFYLTLIPTNFPHNAILNLKTEGFALKEPQETKVRINNSNNLVDAESGQELIFYLFDMVKGEPFTYTLYNEKLSAKAIVVPNSIKATDPKGHTLNLTMISRYGDIFIMEAAGFEPFEKIEYISISEDETLRVDIQAEKDGKIFAIVEPRVIGKILGDASIELVGKSTSNLKVNYRWGLGIFTPKSQKYIDDEDDYY